MRIIRVGSRDSELAVAQARLVMEAIRHFNPEIETRLVTMKTTGDRILDRPLEAIGGKGLFVKELDEALLDGRVDICVHSYKDMPVPTPSELPIAAVGSREDPRDVLVLPVGAVEMPDGPIGTSSMRRTCQLAHLLPGRRTVPVRGNIQTRLRKLAAGDCAALLLAAAGLRRLGLEKRISRTFTVKEMLPAACQGVLAVQGRAGESHEYLGEYNDAAAFDCCVAERAFIGGLGASCTSPVAVHAQIEGETIRVAGLFMDKANRMYRGLRSGRRAEAEKVGRELASAVLGGEAR